MGRSPCCSKEGLNRGAWTAHEDKILIDYIKTHGEGKWSSIPKKAGLRRCGKSCRLRWLNYLRPDIKRGNISQEEEDLIVRLHKLLGNRWSLIAGRLPGRTDNEVKNYWNTTLGKKVKGNHPKQTKDEKKKGKFKSTVVRAQALRCTRTFFAARGNDRDKDVDDVVAWDSKSSDGVVFSMASEEEDAPDFTVQMNTAVPSSLEFSDSDFWKTIYLNNKGDEDGTTEPWPNSSQQQRFLSEEMLKDWTIDESFVFQN